MKKGKKNFKIEVPVDVYSLEKHLYSLMFSGVYVSNTDIKKILDTMGYEASFDSRENLFELLFSKAEEEGKKIEVYQHLMTLVQERKARYTRLKEAYPKAAPKGIDLWIAKTDKTLERMVDEKARLANA